jgi:hypothetical protein
MGISCEVLTDSNAIISVCCRPFECGSDLDEYRVGDRIRGNELYGLGTCR